MHGDHPLIRLVKRVNDVLNARWTFPIAVVLVVVALILLFFGRDLKVVLSSN